MPRHTRLTLLELGASPLAWASHYGPGADDCLVIAQQSDESGLEFSDRVRQRARRLYREAALLDSVDVYASPHGDESSASARRSVIEELANHMTAGGHLTLWSAAKGTENYADLAASLAQISPGLANRQIAISHQTCEPEAQSGIQHAIPTLLTRGTVIEDHLLYRDIG
jgi:hypothetical protein